MNNGTVNRLPSQIAWATLSVVCSLLLLAAHPASAAPATPAEPAPPESAVSKSAETESSTIDRVHRQLSETISSSAGWMDKFFDDPNYSDEDNRSTFRLTLSSLIEDGEDVDFGAKIRFRVALPRWENRLQLIIAGDSEDAESIDGDFEDDDFELGREGDRSAAIGLKYFTRQTKRHNVSLGGGVRWRDGSPRLFIEPRYRFFSDIGTWDMRFIQKVGWFDPEGWESSSKLQFERTFGDEYFFRTEGRLYWYEDDEGWFPQLNFILRKPLSQKRVVAFEWRNYFETKPENILESSVLKLRYRQRVYRRWLWFEVAPQVTFPEDEDYDWKPGITFKLEAYFGLSHLNSPMKLDE